MDSTISSVLSLTTTSGADALCNADAAGYGAPFPSSGWFALLVTNNRALTGGSATLTYLIQQIFTSVQHNASNPLVNVYLSNGQYVGQALGTLVSDVTQNALLGSITADAGYEQQYRFANGNPASPTATAVTAWIGVPGDGSSVSTNCQGWTNNDGFTGVYVALKTVGVGDAMFSTSNEQACSTGTAVMLCVHV